MQGWKVTDELATVDTMTDRQTSDKKWTENEGPEFAGLEADRRKMTDWKSLGWKMMDVFNATSIVTCNDETMQQGASQLT